MAPLHVDEADHMIRVDRISSVLEGTRLHVAFQPIFDLWDGGVHGVEALARFHLEPQRTADRWFAEAEDVGLGVELDMLAVRRALASVRRVPTGAFLSLNVSPGTLRSEAFLDALAAAPRAAIVLEVSEAPALRRLEDLAEAIPAIRASGARFAIDGMQWDPENVSSLLALGPDFVKIELGLSHQIHLDPARQEQVRELVVHAGMSGAVPIAMGLQARGEIESIRELGVGLGQSFYLAVPGPLPLPDTSAVTRLFAG